MYGIFAHNNVLNFSAFWENEFIMNAILYLFPIYFI